VLDTVFRTICRHNMLARGQRVLAAVSGGPDSVCLLEVLATLAGRLGFTLAGIAHFNHKLRGEESEQDERLVEALATRHGIQFYRSEGLASRGNLEQEARRARQKFFRSLIREGKADRIALGHTRDDQAETVLLRLMRGSGLTGLAGVLPVTRDGFVRPLLDSTRAEVEDFLRAQGVHWRQDRSNFDPRFTRNRVRHDLLPKLRSDYNPQISESLAQLAELAHDEEALWTNEVAKVAGGLVLQSPFGVEVRAEKLASLPRALGRRLVRHAIGLAKGNLRRIEFQHVEKVLALSSSPHGTGAARLPGVTVVRSLDWLRLFAGHSVLRIDPIPVEVPGYYPLPHSNTYITLEVAERKDSLSLNQDRNPYVTLEVELCWKRVHGPLELRGWRTGDAYRPQGRSRVYSMRELFQEFRIPSWRRSSWPILLCSSLNGSGSQAEILWARGFGGAHGLLADADAGPVLRISEKQESFAIGVASY
jgi:tRNA(Ile)-lysidine synthase